MKCFLWQYVFRIIISASQQKIVASYQQQIEKKKKLYEVFHRNFNKLLLSFSFPSSWHNHHHIIHERTMQNIVTNVIPAGRSLPFYAGVYNHRMEFGENGKYCIFIYLLIFTFFLFLSLFFLIFIHFDIEWKWMERRKKCLFCWVRNKIAKKKYEQRLWVF